MVKAPWDTKFSSGTRGLYEAGVVFGPLAAVPAMGYALMAASAAMTVAGGVSQSNAQRAAGATAAANAEQTSNMAQVQANQMVVAAGQQQAAGERQAIQEQQKAKLMAGRAKAVMAASGAGEDPNLIAGLLGQGGYNADMDMYNANEKARGLTNQAAMTRWSGDSSVWSGTNTQNNDNAAADSTIIGSVAKGAISFADYYGAPKSGLTNGVTSKQVGGPDGFAGLNAPFPDVGGADGFAGLNYDPSWYQGRVV